jgi:hypothetical protein
MENAVSVRIYTSKPRALLKEIKNLIDEGHIKTWAYDSDGDFTHSAQQFNKKAWLSPEVLDDGLRMKIVASKEYDLTRFLYAVYHGRFIEMLITHVPDLFTKAVATADPTAGEPSIVD